MVGFGLATVLLVGCLAAASAPIRPAPESASADETGARLEWVETCCSDPGLAWTTDVHDSRVLVAEGTGHAVVERRLRRATDDMDYRHVDATPALPAGTPWAYAVVLPGGALPTVGPVASIRAPQLERGRNATYVLRHPRIGQAGLSQQCRPDRTGHGWCAIAISNGQNVRLLDAYSVANARQGGYSRLELSFAGDLNADGVFDLILEWNSQGGIGCVGWGLFVSARTQDGWRWPMASDGACD